MCIAFAAPARMPGSKRMGTPGSSRRSRLLLTPGEDTGDVSNDRALGGGNGAVAPRGLRGRGRFRHQRGDGEPARCRCRYCPARRAGLLTRRAEGARPIVPYGGRVPVQAVRELPSPIDRTGRALLVGHSDARPGTRPPRRECCARVIHSDGALGQNGHGAWGNVRSGSGTGHSGHRGRRVSRACRRLSWGQESGSDPASGSATWAGATVGVELLPSAVGADERAQYS